MRAWTSWSYAQKSASWNLRSSYIISDLKISFYTNISRSSFQEIASPRGWYIISRNFEDLYFSVEKTKRARGWRREGDDDATQLAHVTSYLLTWEQFAGDTLATEITTEDKDKCIALDASGWLLQNVKARFIPWQLESGGAYQKTY